MSAGDRLTSWAVCWRVERRDGVTLTLTDHDGDLTVGGVRYRAAPGMTPTAIVRDDTLDADTMAASGALGTDALRADDLAAGRWDGARVRVFAIDWSDAAAGPIPLGEGTMGEVAMRDGGFTAELSGAAAALERPVCEVTSPDCRAELGDARCRVPMAARRRHARIVSVEGTRVTLDTDEPAANAWGDGRLRWMGGTNCGLESLVSGSAGRVVTLRAPPPFAALPGTLVRMTEGCDKRIATCHARFGNAANFRGEPYLPGVDLLTRYPGQ